MQVPAEDGWRQACRNLTIACDLSRMLAEAPDWEDVRAKALQSLCEGFGWAFGAHWELDSSGRLRCAEFTCASTEFSPGFQAVSQSVRLLRGQGLPGRAWHEMRAMTGGLPDVDQARAPLAQDLGFTSALAIPLQSERQFFGVLEFFSRDPITFEGSLEAAITAVAAQLGRLIASSRMVAAIKESDSRQQILVRHYRQLFDNNPQPMWVYDRETLAFLEVNQAASRTYGYSRDEFLSMSLQDIRPPEDVGKLLSVTSTPVFGFRNAGAWRHQKKDGTTIAVEIFENHMNFDGRNACLVMTIDISERQRLEEQVRQSQRLESIGRLAGGVAHDFNNLLTVINGYTELAMAKLAPDHPVRESLTEVRAAGERATTLTQQLLGFSRRQPVDQTVVNVNAVAADIEKMLRRLIGADIELVTRLASDLGNIKANEGHVQQILMNLAVNARDAMPRGGTLILETRNASFDEAYASGRLGVVPGPYVMLSVTDTGTGISPEVKERLFEPFFTTKEKGKGTGLGLATVYAMVKVSGGFIWVYSELGHGASFKIYWPRTDRVAPEPELVAVKELRGTESILILEDQPEVRSFLTAALRQYGYTVYAANSPAEAVAFGRDFEGPLHLLITDVVMPEMDGRELAKALVDVRPSLGVLFMSGYTEHAVMRHEGHDPSPPFLQKPFSSQALAAKVREVLSGATDRATASS